MAPYRKLTQKELKREQMSWITRGILVSMGIRDTLYKTWMKKRLNLRIELLHYTKVIAI